MKLATLVLISVAVTAALSVTGQITESEVGDDMAQTTVTLNNGQFVTYLRKDGSFIFPDVPQGTHLLRVQSSGCQFDIYRIDVIGKKVSATLTLPGASLKTTGPETAYPLEISPRARYDYFIPREGFNPINLLKNPMLLMSVGAFVMMFLLPKLTEGMDPAELKEIQKKQINPAAQMPDIGANLAAYLSGSKDGSNSGRKA